MEFGPDNALYTLEYGTGYFAELPAAQLARIDYVRGGQYTPVVRGTATPSSGTTAPLTVKFSSAGHDGRQRRPPGLHVGLRLQRHGRLRAWRTRRYTYTARGVYEATLRVTDQTGRSASWQVARRRRQPGAAGVPQRRQHDPAVQLRRHGQLHGHRHRRPAGRLRARQRGLHPRPRDARASADLDGRMHGPRSRSRSTRRTPARRTSAPCSSPPTPTTRAAASRRSRAARRSASCRRLRRPTRASKTKPAGVPRWRHPGVIWAAV